MRRALDTALALAGVVLLLPLLALLAALTMALLGRPVLFRQHRAGLGGRTFRIVKFRSMSDDRDAAGVLLPDDRRLGRFGRALRRSRLDELPELWNIVRGDMAFVGPRPLFPETVTALGADGRRRGAVRPGLTGLAQISGNTLLSSAEKIAIDLRYVDRRSAGLDLLILLCTPLVMLFGERRGGPLLPRDHASGDRRRG